MIKNKTKITQEAVKAAMVASNFSDDRYKKIKVIYNFFGLLSGIMFVRYLSLQLLGSDEANTGFTVLFGVVTAVFLFIGMYGMDKSKIKIFRQVYQDIMDTYIEYVIDNEGIGIGHEDNEVDKNMILWKNISHWKEDVDYFFIFMDDKTAFIIKKSEFTQGSASDLKKMLTSLHIDKLH